MSIIILCWLLAFLQGKPRPQPQPQPQPNAQTQAQL